MTHIPGGDFNYDIAQGNVDGQLHFNKFGFNLDVDTGSVPEDIWSRGGLWVPPTGASIHDVASGSAQDSGLERSSGSATGGTTTTLVDTAADFVSDGVAVGDCIMNDTQGDYGIVTAVAAQTLTVTHFNRDTTPAAGDTYRVATGDATGAAVIEWQGLNSDWQLAKRIYTIMNGTANVETPSLQRIYRGEVVLGTSGNQNVGTITATSKNDGTVTAEIPADRGKTAMAIFTVPAGYEAWITRPYANINRASGAGAAADMELVYRNNAHEGSKHEITNHYWTAAIDGATNVQLGYKPEKYAQERTDILIRCNSVTGNNTSLACGFDIKLRQKES